MKHGLHPEGRWGTWERWKRRHDGGLLGYNLVNAEVGVYIEGEGQVILPREVGEDFFLTNLFNQPCTLVPPVRPEGKAVPLPILLHFLSLNVTESDPNVSKVPSCFSPGSDHGFPLLLILYPSPGAQDAFFL